MHTCLGYTITCGLYICAVEWENFFLFSQLIKKHVIHLRVYLNRKFRFVTRYSTKLWHLVVVVVNKVENYR